MNILLLGLFFLAPSLYAASCAESLRVTGLWITEERIEVETKKEGVTYGKIIKCLRANSDRFGDFKFREPSKEEAKISFGRHQKVMISKNEYDPHHWIASYDHVTENLHGDDDVDLLMIHHRLNLSHKIRMQRSFFFDWTLGLSFVRGHLVNPDAQTDAANDLAPTGAARFRFQLPRSNDVYLSVSADRFYTFDEDGDEFIYRGHTQLGWEGMILPGFSLGAFGGLNMLVEDGSPAEEFGGLMKFSYYALSASYRLMYERIEKDETDVRGLRHTVSLAVEF